jgi:putative spermidine/putrescine transport system ATP-binding protein
VSIAIALQNVSKSFGMVKAVDGVNLEIADGEFFAMLGPSGSGKTTVLRLIAGFELPDAGHIEIDGGFLKMVQRAAGFNFRRIITYL